MGTRSDIIVHCVDGKWRRAYCHWDGYLSHNGRILFDHYTTREQASKLVSLGDMSSLAAKCSKPKGHSYHNKVDGYTVYYGRDRGEKGTKPVVGDTLLEVWPPEDTWTEFTYVFADKGNGFCWHVASPDEGTQCLRDLGAVLTGQATPEFPIKVFGAIIGTHNVKADRKIDSRSEADK